MLKVKEFKNKKEWESFLVRDELEIYPLFQSWNWGEVQKKLGFRIFRVGFYEKEVLVGVCQIIDIKAKRGHYLHLRHGPVFINFKNSYLKDLLLFIKEAPWAKNIDFLRMSPLVRKENIDADYLHKMGFRSAPIHNQDAEICWVLNLDSSEHDLFKGFRKTHRYLIKKAQELGVEIVKTARAEDLELFFPLYKDLSARKGFVPHRGIREEFEVFVKDNEILLFLAKYQGKIIASALILLVADTAIYHHGASSLEFRNIPASYLLQWEAILEAKKRGKRLYNFWGIAPTSSRNHPWQGLTLFKTGFGGERREFLHAQDLPLSVNYWKTYLIESLSKKIKGY
ncbi:MAG: peptidoglycan bridge formation glycyltransferase FemA/FemB family protein [Patescibacteria group bacterium]|nr:peptidoglycan bridge formation glycyltransferase FemA/FemB family protein [Patescibacteria group bacterium]